MSNILCGYSMLHQGTMFQRGMQVICVPDKAHGDQHLMGLIQTLEDTMVRRANKPKDQQFEEDGVEIVVVTQTPYTHECPDNEEVWKQLWAIEDGIVRTDYE